MLPLFKEKIQRLYVIVASGPSMNLAKVRTKLTIERIVLIKYQKNNDIVIAVIDDMATIKRYKEDKVHDRIILQVKSTEKYLPIFLHKEDNFLISGKVIDVVKRTT